MGEHREPGTHRPVAAGVLLGIGTGGLFDGIVLHQLLQWHHMVSHVDHYPTNTVTGLEANTLADGLFHAATLAVTLAGLWLLWRAAQRPGTSWSTGAFVGLLLVGFGAFNVVEGVVDHLILRVHHVREHSSHQLAWDLGFLVWGLVMLAGGIALSRRGRDPAPAQRQGGTA